MREWRRVVIGEVKGKGGPRYTEQAGEPVLKKLLQPARKLEVAAKTSLRLGHDSNLRSVRLCPPFIRAYIEAVDHCLHCASSPHGSICIEA